MTAGHAAVAALIDKGEWSIEYVYDAGDLSSECLCGKAIRHEHYVRNVATGQLVMLGSSHAPWLVQTAQALAEAKAKEVWKGMKTDYRQRTREPVAGWRVFREILPGHQFSNTMWERHAAGLRLTKNMRDKLREIIEEKRPIIQRRLAKTAATLRAEAEADLRTRVEKNRRK